MIRSLLSFAIVCLMASLSRGHAATPAACLFTPNPGTPIFAGVQLQNMQVVCRWNGNDLMSAVHVVRVDLATKGVSLVTLSAGTPMTQQMLLISDKLQQSKLQIAVNANLFTNCCTYSGSGTFTSLLGLAYGNGAMWSPIGNNPPERSPPPGDFLSSLIVANGQVSIVTLTKGHDLPYGLTLAVTGTHRILTDGKNTAPGDTTPADWFGPNARTVVGFHAGSNGADPTLWLVAVDASNGSAGVTLPQAAVILQFLGASDGINLDGGGSTAMVRQGANGAAAFVNVPKDWPPFGSCAVRVVQGSSCERYVGFGLGVVAPPLP
jgi:hypothetical protein